MGGRQSQAETSTVVDLPPNKPPPVVHIQEIGSRRGNDSHVHGDAMI